MKLENMMNDRLKGVSPEELVNILAGQDVVSDASLSSDHSDAGEDAQDSYPEDETAFLQRRIEKHMSQEADQLLNQNSLKEEEETQRLRLAIIDDPSLAESDKEGLINDFNANLQRINDLLDGDKDKSKSALNKRLQERAARRRAQNLLATQT